MRAGFSEALTQRLRGTPRRAYAIAELAAIDQEDLILTKDQWAGADVFAGVQHDALGGVRLTHSIATHVENTTSDGVFTDLDGPPTLQGADPFPAAVVTWGGTEDPGFMVTEVTARLDPNVSGGGANVAFWYCQPYALIEVQDPGRGVEYSLLPLAFPVRVQAGGIESDVTFDFSSQPWLPKLYGAPAGGTAENGFNKPVTYIFIWAVQADGSAATNVGWRRDSTKTSVSNGNTTLTSEQLVFSSQTTGRYESFASTGGLLRCAIKTASLTAATLTFSGVGNQLDLGAAPTNEVEFFIRAAVPPGSSVTFQVRNDADTDWVTVADGDITPLTGVTKSQTRKVRVTLSPNSAASVGPIAREIGMREIAFTRFDELVAEPRVSWSVDPLTGIGEIMDAAVAVLKDGVRDFKDAITTQLSTHDLSKLQLRLWIGAADLARSEWGLLDSYQVAGYDPTPSAVVLRGFPVLSHAKRTLPKYNPVSNNRDPLVYAGQTRKFVYDDLLRNQLELDDRLIGPEIEDATTLVDNRFDAGDTSNGKSQLDALTRLGGEALVHSQGRIKVVPFRTRASPTNSIVAIFPKEEIEVIASDPGFEYATAEFIVPHGYDFDRKQFTRITQRINTPALTALDIPPVDAIPELPASVARWIPATAAGDTLAGEVAADVVDTFGTGLIRVRFRAMYPHPWLEPGDVVAVELEDFVAKDPYTAAAIKGLLWAVGRVMHVGDALGTDLSVWIPSFRYLISQSTDDDLTGQLEPTAPGLRVDSFFRGNELQLSVTLPTGYASFKWATSFVSQPAAGTGTIRNATPGLEDTFATAVTPTYGQTVFITVTPYSGTGATGTQGSASQLVRKALWEETQFDLTSGKRKRIAQFDDDKYALRATDTTGETADAAVKDSEGVELRRKLRSADVAGKEAFDDLFVLSTKTVKVGTVASPSTITKTIRIPYGEFTAGNETLTWAFQPGLIHPNSTGLSGENWTAPVVAPPGVTLTQIQANLFRNTDSDVIKLRLYRVTGNGVATLLATLQHIPLGTGWATVSASLNELVSSANGYVLTLEMDSVNLASDTSFTWAELQYTMPSYDKGI